MTHQNKRKQCDDGPEQRFYHMEEAARYLGISRSTFIRHYKNGPNPIPTIIVGKREMYDLMDLNQVIEANNKSKKKSPTPAKKAKSVGAKTKAK